MSLPAAPPLFNPFIARPPLSPAEIFAGPFGLLAFLPFVPVVLVAGRRWPRAALVVTGLAWMLATLRPATTLAMLGGLALAVAWVHVLAALRRHGTLGRRGMIALVWIGLVLLIVPVWWQGHDLWYPSRMAVLHTAGIAYLLLRLIGWGVDLAADPSQPRARLGDTAAWLLYAPCMRLGPILRRHDFVRRLAAWDPRGSSAWRAGAGRFALFLVGGVLLGLVGNQLPHKPHRVVDFFADPTGLPTDLLVRVFYLVPIQVYLLLWTYNELAAALSLWIGIPVDNNFNWLPRATSVREFWRRWHITLGAWLRDYVYIPLGGNRRHVSLNYLAVFLFCGVWHGPSWSFVAWGLTQPVALTIQRACDRVRPRALTTGSLGYAWTPIAWLLTMHYQLATILVFVDFEHFGTRILPELLRRLG